MSDDQRETAGGGASARRRRLSVSEQARIALKVGSHQPLIDIVSARTSSFQETLNVLRFIGVYGVYVEQNGREPRSISELALSATSSKHTATVNRWGADFRKAFPEYHLPVLLWAIVRPEVADLLDQADEDRLGFAIGAVII